MSKIAKMGFIGFLTTVVILSQINIPIVVDAESSENAQQVVDETAANATTEQNGESQDETQVQDEHMIDVAGTTGVTAAESGVVVESESDFANLDGVDISGDTAISKEFGVMVGTPSEFNVQASFDGDASVTNRKVVITVGEGLAVSDAPGMKGGNGIWTFNEDLLPSDLKGVIIGATFVSNGKVYGKQTGGGVLTYTIASGISKVLIPVKVKYDLPFAVFTLKREFVNVLNAKTIQDVNGTTTVVNDETLEKFTITDAVGMGARLYAANTIIYALPGEQASVTYSLIGGANNFYPDSGGYLIEEQTYKLVIDKKVGVSSVDFSLPNGRGSYSIDSSSSTTNDILYITLKEVAASYNVQVTIHFTPADTVVSGEKYVFSSSYTSAVTKPYGSEIIAPNSKTGSVSAYNLFISSPYENKLRINDLSFSLASNSYYENTADGYTMIGAFDLSNPQPEKVTNQLVRFQFSDPNFGVRAIDLPSSMGVDVKNIVVKTNKGNTYTIDSAAVTSGYNGTGTAKYRLNVKTLGVTDEHEFITEITYLIQELSPSYKTLYSNEGAGIDSGIYGTMLDMPASKSWSFQMSAVPAADGDFTSTNTQHSTTTVSLVSKPMAYTTTATVPAQNLAGTTSKISAVVGMLGYTLETRTKAKGLEFYLREGEYLNIDSNTIQITNMGKTYSVAAGTLTAVDSIDNTGNKVIKLVVPEIVIGFYDSDDLQKTAVINYNVKVKNTAPSVAIPLNELMYIQTIDSDLTKSMNGFPNKFNVDGSGDTKKLMGGMPSLQSFQITAQKDFSVSTAANLNGGPWTNYDYDLKKFSIDLNPSGAARYQVSVTNNSGNSADGYTVLIPIPKAGEATDMMPENPTDFNKNIHLQAEPFKWTASINEAVVPTGSLSYTVLYSTIYETDKDSAAFVPWSAIVNKDDIRMIKVVTDSVIPDGFNESFSFPLVLSDSEADLHAGLTNIYASRIYTVVKNTAGEITSAGYKNSEPVAIRLKTGVVKGRVFNDVNRDGLLDNGESGYNGVTVTAYEAGTKNIVETTTTKPIAGISGSYEFLGLDKAQKVDIVFTNPTVDDSMRFSPVATGGSTAVPSATNDVATKSGVTPNGTDYDKINAGLISAVTVTMNAGPGGSTAIDAFQLYPGEQITIQPEAVKTGYTFTGWYTATTGDSKVMFPYIVGTADVTLYAQYTVNAYVASFDIAANGGEGTEPANETVNYGEKITQPADAVKAGYTFLGWFDTATDGKKWDFATGKMPAQNLKLYAQFNAENQYITFDANGGTGAPATLIQPTDSSVKLDNLSAPTKPGYTFAGWFDAGGVQYSGTFAMPADGLALQAQWIVADQVISFNTNGGTAVASILAKTDTTVDLDTVSTTRAGYQFAGWFTETTEYSGVITVPAGGLVLVAHWTALDQTITFDINDGETTMMPENIVAPTDSLVDLTRVIVPPRFGYEFTGWIDAKGVGYRGVITMPAGGLALRAQWQNLIVDDIWEMSAKDVRFTVNEVKQLVAAGTLEQEILVRSEAKAWDNHSGALLTPLSITHIDTMLESARVGVYPVAIRYTHPNTIADDETNFAADNILSATIDVYVDNDPETAADILPVTGQNNLILFVGILAIIISILTIIGLAKKRKYGE